MTMNLFSIFDPSTMFVNNWVSLFMCFLVLPFFFWLVYGRLGFASKSLIDYVFLEFKPLLKFSFALILVVSTFFVILLNNVFGLLPYVFCASSHMSFTLSLALIGWGSMMLYGVLLNYKNLLIHLIPTGTSPALMPFMVLVETISNVIRPLTLSIRLCANMIAGHLLITLLGSAVLSSVYYFKSFVVIGMTALMLLEVAVAFIQAYVFGMLLTLYAAELSS
uniref:ATP synthase subunit a n=1 Tax=Metacrangonyx dhofarensis TaxID=2291046 RepID=A0A345UDK1_9CRUS|nr:ATP synthase F0 subunit 6 [Metacrangonyx dhofarensis]